MNYVGKFFLENAGRYLQTGQMLHVAGCSEGKAADTSWFVHGQSRPQPHPAFNCTAEEADT